MIDTGQKLHMPCTSLDSTLYLRIYTRLAIPALKDQSGLPVHNEGHLLPSINFKMAA